MSTFNNTIIGAAVTGSTEADSILNTAAQVLINALDGKDTIDNSGNDVTISGGDSKDTVNNSGERVSVNGGTSGDYIENASLGIHSTLNGDSGDDTVNNFASYVTILGGIGNDILSNERYYDEDNDVYYSADNVSISGGANDDRIDNRGDNVTIDGGDGADTISNDGDYSTVLGGAGTDSIYNYGASVSIDGGAGNDYIDNYDDANAVTIDGGDGADTISNDGDYSTVLGGAGTDSIYNNGDSVKIDGGAGNDSIYNNGDSVKIDGGASNDTITNSSCVSVTIDGGAGDDSIENRYGDSVKIDAGTGGDYIHNWDGANAVTINGDAGADRIENSSDDVAIGGGADNDNITSAGKEVSIDGGTGNDSITSNGNDATISGGTGDDNISVKGSEILFKYASGDGNDTITGFNDSSRLRIGDGTGTYSKATDGDDVIITVGNGKVTLVGAALLGEVNIQGTEASAAPQWQLNGTTATYGTAGNTLITVSEVKSLDGISLNDKVVTISAASLGTSKVTISSGYTLALGAGVAVPKTVAASYNANTQTYTGAGKTAGYTLANNAISYSASTSKEFKFSGVADGAVASNFYPSGTTITIGKAAVKTDGTPVKLLSDNGYTLKLGKGMGAAKTVAASYDAKTMTYTSAGKSAGYTLANNAISYSAGTSKEFKFSGVADGAVASNFFPSGTTLTIGKAAVKTNGTPVKLLSDNGYTLKLGKGMGAATNVAAKYDAKTMTYTSAGKTEGYALSKDAKTINYTPSTSVEFKFSGIADGAVASNFFLSGTTITIGKAAVKTDGTAAKLLSDNGYTLKLGKGMTSATTVGVSTLEDGLYTAAGQTAGYTLSHGGKVIKYREALDTAFELDGVVAEPTTPTNGVVTLNPANFDKRFSIVSNEAEYAFAIAKGTYTGKTFTGSSDADTITNAGANLIINAAKGNDSIENSGAGVKINSGLGNDYVKNSGANVTLNGGIGNDTLWGGSYADTFVYKSGDGNDIIGGFDDNDLLQITGTFTTAYDSAAGTIKFTVGTGSVTLQDFTATTFNVNGDAYQISGKMLVK